MCDGKIDCQDLSDECTCENSKVKPFCDVFYNKNVPKKSSYDFSTVWNFEHDFSEGIDEKYCK